ncbi:tyrosine-protein phosphatase [Microbacterium sp.]|uniref:tyrosine-protein phosphatase n=1 Tax=Microbacterium sp. TaxID=51671 RepID=UPI002627F439|nr:tyrosine-protein phosphatase [Microbacterium sp.]
MTVIAVDGVFNVRDVGGIAAGSGRIRSGRLVRSGGLADATPAGVAELERRVSHIVDLRDDQEVAADPSATRRIETTHLPLFLGSVTSFFTEDLGLEDMYRQLITESGERLVEAVRIIATSESTLVHCTVGKDRTGITIALALAAVGADREEVIADYALTESQLPEERNRRIMAFLQSQHPEARHALALATQSPADVMRGILREVDERWGSAAEYLLAHGLTEEELTALRDALVEEVEP